ncbi:MAG TPA: hypothetical protein VGE26_02065 [Sphingobacteriaceae bacterium]
MKKLLIVVVTFLAFISGCKKDPALAMEYREIAWSALDDIEKASITSDWKTSLVKDETYHGRFVVAVVFTVNENSREKTITVYIDPDNREVLGTEELTEQQLLISYRKI